MNEVMKQAVGVDSAFYSRDVSYDSILMRKRKDQSGNYVR